MACLADAQQLHIDPACLSNEVLIASRLGSQIVRHAIRDVRIGKVNIHSTKQMMIHVKAVGVFVLGRDADVFIQVERAAPREVQTFAPLQSDQPVIDTFHRAAGGQPQHQLRFRAQPCRD